MKIVRPALYLVGTPIGNLDDMSPRAVEILSECDFVAAEDTRVSSKLLSAFDIRKPMISYYEHNIRERGEEIIARLMQNQCCALVTDAGMPAISDPGEDIVKLCAERSIPVYVVPGPSAVVSAIAVSGLSTSRFTFEGFLTVKKTGRKKHLDSLKNETRTMVFYEAPHKLKNTLADLCDAFGADRRISLVRELTKLHEEVIRTTIGEAIKLYESDDPRGEFVLVLEGASEEAQTVEFTEEAALEHFSELVANGTDKKSAVKLTAEYFGVQKSIVYSICMKK